MVAFQGGGLAPMLPAHKLLDPLGLGIVFKVDLDFDFRSSWGRFGLRLGGHFRSFWRLGRPKLVPRSSLNRPNIEKVIFQKNERRRGREHDFEVQVFPRWLRRRFKIDSRRSQARLRSVLGALIFRFDF